MELKLVYAAKLDSDLGTVADAIRERGGTADQLSFPEGMVEAVVGIADYKAILNSMVDGSITEFKSDEITAVPNDAFANRTKLISLSLSKLINGSSAMCQNCSKLVDIYLPLMKSAGNNAFQGIGAKSVDLPSLERVHANFFQNAKQLTTFILRNPNSISLLGAGAFSGTPITDGTGYIYVPKALVDSYKAATNWSTFADQIRAIEDYTEITGGATV